MLVFDPFYRLAALVTHTYNNNFKANAQGYQGIIITKKVCYLKYLGQFGPLIVNEMKNTGHFNINEYDCKDNCGYKICI